MDRLAALLMLCILAVGGARAQTYEKPDHDTSYYRSFKGTIIARVYLSRSYLHFNADPPPGIHEVNYHVNKPLSLGLGLTYKSLSFSYSKGLNFIHSNKDKVPTKSTDLQLHLYKRKWTIDALASFYKGYYLDSKGVGVNDGSKYYVRPDLNIKLFGTSVYRVLNDQRFCYGAGLSQNAWQQKSAGSFLVGAEAFYAFMGGDSSFVPYNVDSNYAKGNIHKLNIFEMGLGIGYAYTLVIQKRYYLLGSLNFNYNFRYSHETGHGIGANKVGFSPNYLLRLGAGYNTNTWGLSLAWLSTGLKLPSKAFDYHYSINAGNYRLVYARRLAINHKMRRIIGPEG
ncbi:MAG TPA: DUF4421 family protein [Puia sp.]|nr:DUF4421 family protein [Puia sp.]